MKPTDEIRRLLPLVFSAETKTSCEEIEKVCDTLDTTIARDYVLRAVAAALADCVKGNASGLNCDKMALAAYNATINAATKGSGT